MIASRVIMRHGARRSAVRLFSEGQNQNSGPSGNSSSSSVNTNVPGLSSAVLDSPTKPVGPGVEPNKTGSYKVPEYYCYNNTSFYEAEIEMAKYRLPQPSALKQ